MSMTEDEADRCLNEIDRTLNRFEMLEAYVMESLNLFINEPPCTLYQIGQQAALVEVATILLGKPVPPEWTKGSLKIKEG